jgi:large subunit ribosomal protein L29
MNAQDLRAKNEGELREQLTGLLHTQFNLRMQKGSGQMVTPHDLRGVRREIARVRTILNEKAREGRGA